MWRNFMHGEGHSHGNKSRPVHSSTNGDTAEGCWIPSQALRSWRSDRSAHSALCLRHSYWTSSCAAPGSTLMSTRETVGKNSEPRSDPFYSKVSSEACIAQRTFASLPNLHAEFGNKPCSRISTHIRLASSTPAGSRSYHGPCPSLFLSEAEHIFFRFRWTVSQLALWPFTSSIRFDRHGCIVAVSKFVGSHSGFLFIYHQVPAGHVFLHCQFLFALFLSEGGHGFFTFSLFSLEEKDVVPSLSVERRARFLFPQS